jgi:hypothetical protein
VEEGRKGEGTRGGHERCIRVVRSRNSERGQIRTGSVITADQETKNLRRQTKARTKQLRVSE